MTVPRETIIAILVFVVGSTIGVIAAYLWAKSYAQMEEDWP